jgi:hypothetical protein
MPSAVQTLSQQRLADHEFGLGNQFGENWSGGGMRFTAAMGSECGLVRVDLGSPKNQWVILGTVDGVEECARLYFDLFELGREGSNILVGPTFLNGDPGNDCDMWHSSSRKTDTYSW